MLQGDNAQPRFTTPLSQSVVFLPDGRPAPAVLTADETVALLRLDAQTGDRTLKYYRDEGQLVGVRIGRKVRYPLSEILRFIEEKTDQSRKNGLTSRCS